MLSRAVDVIAHRSLVVFSLLVIMAASAVSTQAQNADQKLVFNVPFQFTAGGERLPAGEYIIRRVSQTGSAYLIQSRDRRATVTVTSKNTLRPDAADAPPQLTFNVYAGQYFLSQIRPGVNGAGIELHRSRAEREVAQDAESQRVIIVSRK